jgi:uncharacterized membrane protein YdfJ with MMPL/SSD domain
MARLARWCFAHRWRVVAAWLLALAAEFGFALGFSVLIDALVIRGLLVPALMHLLGPATWALPGWLDRLLPHLAAEPGDHAPATDPEGVLS